MPVINTPSRQRQQQRNHEVAMLNKQYEQAIEFWNMQNAYNTPSAQLERYREAGLNPTFAQVSAGNASSAPQGPDWQSVPYHGRPTIDEVMRQGATDFQGISEMLNQRSKTLNQRANDAIRNQVMLMNANNNARFKEAGLGYQEEALRLRANDSFRRALNADRDYELRVKEFDMRSALANMNLKIDSAKLGLMSQEAARRKLALERAVDEYREWQGQALNRSINANTDTQIRQHRAYLLSLVEEDERWARENLPDDRVYDWWKNEILGTVGDVVDVTSRAINIFKPSKQISRTYNSYHDIYNNNY